MPLFTPYTSQSTTLGYAQITASLASASTSFVQVTGLTSTVTIPAGGRRIKITVFAKSMLNAGGANTYSELSIWDGTVGTGTQLSDSTAMMAVAVQEFPVTCIAVVNPTAGSKTYNVGIKSSNASFSATITAATTNPAFILVELI